MSNVYAIRLHTLIHFVHVQKHNLASEYMQYTPTYVNVFGTNTAYAQRTQHQQQQQQKQKQQQKQQHNKSNNKVCVCVLFSVVFLFT